MLSALAALQRKPLLPPEWRLAGATSSVRVRAYGLGLARLTWSQKNRTFHITLTAAGARRLTLAGTAPYRGDVRL